MSRRLNGWQRLWSFGAVALLAAVTLPAQTFDDALAAYKRGEIGVAVKAFSRLAEQGHAKAQYFLGFLYAEGEGVPQDKAEAARWYRKAAEQGYAEAQFNLGVMYENGEGVPEDKAAEQGDTDAQSNLRRLAQEQTPQGVRGPSALTVFGGLLLYLLVGYLVKFYREHPRMK